MRKKVKKNEKKTVIRTYEVDEKLLTLILMVENFVYDSSFNFPLEVRKCTYDYLKKLSNCAGLDEEKYIDWDIKNYKYLVEYEFEKNK